MTAVSPGVLILLGLALVTAAIFIAAAWGRVPIGMERPARPERPTARPGSHRTRSQRPRDGTQAAENALGDPAVSTISENLR
ncbi:hypothetical protein Bequi_01140 [Brachybacterium sp. JHP9]|uniref:Uncharacterized protein n=1 Tax=Brachybacterium equifaecis TaxID=2910770 RepID=A0ABT0QXX4_9MICO|nr:hypothetical protein [Brachybacterium equifaecis]MCL6422003.1 hypothetical protein [Brachybacterium equifaecis]